MKGFRVWLEAILTQEMDPSGKAVHLPGIRKGSNPLIPYGPWRIKDEKLPFMSGFLRDQPDLSRFALANPENLSHVIIFVLLTIRADFQQVMHDFPSIMTMLYHKFGDREASRHEIAQAIEDMQVRLSQQVNPGIMDDSGYAAGYGLKTTAFGFKNDGIAEVWSDRERNYDQVKKFADKHDPVGMFQFLTNKITGLAPVKAGFCVQLIMGRLGCIDMHNINLYSQYAKFYGKDKLHADLEPMKFSKKNEAGMNHYLSVLDQLAAEGADTVKLWDIWTNFVAHNYTNPKTGKSNYDITSKFSGYSIDPDDPLQQKLKQMGDVPNRPGAGSGTDTMFSMGDSPGANTGSQAHRIISQIRNKQYYLDLLHAAEHPDDIPDEVRVSSARRPNKVLAYLVSEPKMALDLGLGKDFLSRARAVLEKHGVFPGRNFRLRGGQQVFDFAQPEALGRKHVPSRIKTVKKPKEAPSVASARELF